MRSRLNWKQRLGVLSLAAMVVGSAWWAGSASAEPEAARNLAVVWTSGDPEVAHRVAFMYTQAAASQGWFDQVRLIIWGPSQRLLVGDQDIQEAVSQMEAAGVRVDACIMCAESYGIVDQLRGLGLNVEGMGRPLTEALHDEDWQVLTF